MILKSITELEEQHDFEIPRIINEIKKNKAKTVLLQFPDGLKQHATTIVDALSEKLSNVEFRISLDSCFGACDLPQTDCDLIVQFGHAKWK